MKIDTINRDDHQVNLVVELEEDIQEKYMHRAARKISESGKIAGFRPGKAPYDVVKRTYGDKVIEQEAMELIIDEIYPQVLEQASIEPSGPGSLDGTPTMNPPKFNFLVPLKPKIVLPDIHSFHQDYQPDPVDDSQVEATLKRLQMNNAVANPVDRPATTNDLVGGLVTALLLDPPQADDAILFSDKPFELIIDESDQENMSLPYPGFLKDIIGMSANEEKTILHPFDDQETSEKIRGKEVQFNVRLQSVKELTLPELNDDFAKSQGDYSTIEDVKKAIRDEIERYNQQSYDDDYFNRLIQTISDQSTIKYPPHLLEDEIKNVLQDVERNLSYRRLDFPSYLKSLNIEMDAYIEKEIRPIAEKRLKQSLVMEEIIQSEKITIGKDELQSATVQTVGDISKLPVRNLPRGTTKSDYLMAATYQTANALLTQRLRDHLKSIATTNSEDQLSSAINDKPKKKRATKKEVTSDPVTKKPARKSAKENPAQ